MRVRLVLCAILLWTAELGVPSVAHSLRVELLRSREKSNNIILICRNNSMTLEDADFWVNSTDQPLTSILSSYNKRKGGIQFLLHPDIEGFYYCGNISTDLVSSNNWTLVAYPLQSQNFSDYYTAEAGSTITLSCPFARGALSQFYSYSWFRGGDPVVNNMRHIQRFSGNSTDFSLTIQSVILSDNSEYLCRVVITNPIGNDWTIDSDPIQLCVYDTTVSSVSMMNRCAVISTPAVSPYSLSTTPVSIPVSITTNTTSTMSTMNVESTMNSPYHSPLALHEVIYIVVGGIFFVLTFSLCAIGPIVAFKVQSKRRSRYIQRQTDNTDEENQIPSEQVQGRDGSSVLEPVDDNTTRRDRSPSEIQTQTSETLECASLEVQPANNMEQLPSQEHTVSPSDETRNVPGSLQIAQSINETHQGNMHIPNSPSQFERQSRQDSGLAMLSPLSDIVTSSSAQSRSCPTRSSDVFILQSTEDYQVDSNELMFLGSVRSVVCDFRGGRFLIEEHDITLNFPQGAVPGTTKLKVEVRVAIHGLFVFPDDLRPISVLVWVQAERPNFEFQKPIDISLPHYLDLSTNDVYSSNLGLGFMVTDGEKDDHHRLIFKEGAKDQVSYKQTNATISTTHFCYVCLSAKASVIAEKSLYLLTQVQPEPITSLRWQIHFCVSYDLFSFVEMIKQQYLSQGKVVNQGTFHFTPSPLGNKPELKISFETPIEGWQLTLPTYKTIPQSDVELWEDDVSKLQKRVKLQLFPPRVTVEVAGGSAVCNTTQRFSFEGADTKLESEVHLCLPEQHVAQHKNTLLESHHLRTSEQDLLQQNRALTSSHSCSDSILNSPQHQAQQRYQLQLRSRHPSIPEQGSHQTRALTSSHSWPDNMVSLQQYQVHPEEPTDWELYEVMKVIAGGMGSNWRTLIPVLGIPPDKEEEILHDCRGLKDQILKVLRTWRVVHQSNGTSTRAHLAAILRAADPLHLHRAVKLLEKFNANIPSQ